MSTECHHVSYPREGIRRRGVAGYKKQTKIKVYMQSDPIFFSQPNSLFCKPYQNLSRKGRIPEKFQSLCAVTTTIKPIHVLN